MAKKIVRGITDVKTINNQDFDTNNVNDLLSDGQYNYIHRKKGESEEYHNLTDNIKTISSDNTELLSVTNNNKTTNTATLHPKHDAQKEQVLESTRDTISIHHGTNGTDEKTTVDTNPEKVLEHENLLSASEYITIEHEEGGTTSKIKTDKLKSDMTDLSTKITTVEGKIPTSAGGRNLALNTSGYWSSRWTNFNGERNQSRSLYSIFNRGFKIGDKINVRIVIKYSDIVAVEGKTAILLVQSEGNVTHWDSGILNVGEAIYPSAEGDEVVLTGTTTITEEHLRNEFWTWSLRVDHVSSGCIQWKEAKAEVGDLPTPWSPAPEDIYPLLAQKQDVLTAGDGITIQGNTVDTNPQKVLEHENLLTINGISKVTDGNSTTIGLKTIDNYSGDLNELTETCLVKPTDNAVNLPSSGEGILTVVKIGDTVSQQYQSLNSEVFTRVGKYFEGELDWMPWTSGGGGGTV